MERLWRGVRARDGPKALLAHGWAISAVPAEQVRSEGTPERSAGAVCRAGAFWSLLRRQK